MLPAISRMTALTAAVAGLLIGTAAAASAAELPRHADPLSPPAQTITPLFTAADDALSLRDSKDFASMAHLGSLENSKDLASMAHLGSLENADLSDTTSLAGLLDGPGANHSG
ncbi:hypothetical protein [Amycolatopsis sp. NPDC004079]|uniref:hypothetical protein n=1 Tax=Amycolatopsis sp. NPDC004079 TaxID=3154549 RepID=UPI0033AB1492